MICRCYGINHSIHVLMANICLTCKCAFPRISHSILNPSILHSSPPPLRRPHVCPSILHSPPPPLPRPHVCHRHPRQQDLPHPEPHNGRLAGNSVHGQLNPVIYTNPGGFEHPRQSQSRHCAWLPSLHHCRRKHHGHGLLQDGQAATNNLKLLSLQVNQGNVLDL